MSPNYKGGITEDITAYRQDWREKNPDYFSNWSKENRDKANANHAARRARMLEQTPPDACKEKIDWFFAVSANLRESTGKPYHVDHIHPLSKDGPHHEDNLQVLPGHENQRKHAKVGVAPTGITIDVYYALMSAFDFLYSLVCPET